jgi:beta-ketoacyl-acyl-carrier-protein synthase II
MSHNNSRPRVVITGIGAITPLGSSISQFWEGLVAGQSGIRKITQFDASDMPCQIAGEVPDFDPEDYMERKEVRRVARSAQFALGAATQAVTDAGLPDTMVNGERVGVVFGTTIGGLERFDDGIKRLRTVGLSRVNPFALPSGIPNIGAFLIARRFQCFGPNITISTACATGTQVLGEACEYIRRGVADVVISGGTEAIIQDYAIGGFSAMRALPTNYNDAPQSASRPFDAKREGFIFSEGAGAIILESLDHARARGARIYAEFAGHAASSEAFHIAAPNPEAKAPVRTMKWALNDAGINIDGIDYINAHGTSTPLNDAVETKAIKLLFLDHAYNISISSTKSMVGHAMGASGTLEAISTVLSIQNSIIPPTINYEYPDPDCDLDYTPNEAHQRSVNAALSNSFGLGGQNACLVLKRFQE